jgi:hypothetical protein
MKRKDYHFVFSSSTDRESVHTFYEANKFENFDVVAVNTAVHLVTTPGGLRMGKFNLLLCIAALFILQQAAIGQQKLPVINATSTVVDVQDGHNFRKGHWTILPEAELDVYYAQRTTEKKKVTFYTDVDSISFEVEPGQNYDFIILLNNQYSCRTRISTLRRSYRKEDESLPITQDTIPFTLGPDSKIHIEGKVNDSEPLDLIFDTGADNLVLYKSAFSKKAKIEFDGTLENAGMGGTSTRQTSNENRLEIADLRWDHELVMYIEKQADGADGIVGFNVFEDKVVEIDYDKKIITIGSSMPAAIAGYTKLEMHFKTTIPLLDATLINGEKITKDQLIIDTGSSASIHLNRGFAAKNGLYGTMEKLGSSSSRGVGRNTITNEIVLLPELNIGGYTLHRVPIHLEVATAETNDSTGHVGMDVLKRFNTILDYQNNFVYLKPNSSMSMPFQLKSGPSFMNIVAGLSALSALLLAMFIVFRISRKRRLDSPN